MATGSPKGKNANIIDYSLSYSGKKSVDAIFSDIQSLKIDTQKIFPGSSNNISGNLYLGDNLEVLNYLLQHGMKNKVMLVYIDPPYGKMATFSSRKLKLAYEDTLDGAKFLEFLRERLILIKELLSPQGSIYVHLDETMAFPVKVLMDELFGHSNFHNWITRKKSNPKNTTKKKFGDISDYIMFYSKSSKYVFNKQYKPWSLEDAKKEYNYVDSEGRRFKKVPIHAPGIRNGETGKKWHGMLPPTGKHWQYTPEKLSQLDEHGDIYWSATGNPRKKIYLRDSKGIALQDIWLDFKDAHNQNIKVTGYPTEKNEKLLETIIKASSNSGDLVLDAFAGSGTTLAAADKLNRSWIGIDNKELAVKVAVKRLTKGSAKMGDFKSGNEQDLVLNLNTTINRASFNVTSFKPKDSN